MAPDSSDPFQNLLFETSPFGNLDAIVEHDSRAVFFYLNHHEGNRELFPTKACWVRNLTPGPLVINKQEMQTGVPPQLPRTHCKQPIGLPVPEPESLHVVWFEEGNGAALCEQVEAPDNPNVRELKPLAVIPPWSGMEGFHGYATECASQSPICWPMPAGDSNPLLDRIDAARQFWQDFFDESTEPFNIQQPELLKVYESHFGEVEKYFAIDGGQFPPRGLARFRTPEHIVLITVAMSLCPMPNVELHVDQPRWHRRIELGLKLPLATSEESLDKIQRRLSSLAAFPWNRLSWLGQGHTIDFIAGETIGNRPADFVVMASDSFLAERHGTQIELPDFRNDPVNLLWMLPISPEQQQQLSQQELMLEDLVCD